MTDVILAWDNGLGHGDLCIAGADLAADDGLQTAVLVSLFTERRVEADELQPGDTDRRGWWGDRLNDDGDEIGSKLWLLDRRKLESGLPAEVEAAAYEALQWMLADGAVRGVDVSAERTGREAMGLRVVVTRLDNSTREFQFEDVLRAA